MPTKAMNETLKTQSRLTFAEGLCSFPKLQVFFIGTQAQFVPNILSFGVRHYNLCYLFGKMVRKSVKLKKAKCKMQRAKFKMNKCLYYLIFAF